MNEREAEAMQLEILRRMTGGQRLKLALEMTDLGREFARAGIRARQPNWTERQVSRELLRIAFWPDPLPDGLP
ncbi:MAG TPA: hypothetical protein VFP58_14545 [Candidatus Eisenbacteria bacterium]|nr:hypothetical protein [Candidatus Eisenbacteria bacterium]